MNFDSSDGAVLINALENNDQKFIVCHGVQTIYGTGSAQKVYLRVQEFLSKNKRKDWTAENINKHVSTKHIIKENYPEISNYWLSIKDQFIKNDIKVTTSDDSAKKTFWENFQMVYDVNRKDPRAKPAIVKGPEIRAPNAQNFVEREDEILIDDIIVRRSCKFLLYDSINRKQDIAYVLDDLNLDTVAQRITVSENTTRLGLGTEERKVPVCTSELREIFRRWDYFQEHLTFYKDWKVSDPPWFTNGVQHWALYAAHLAVKITGKWPNDGYLLGKRVEIDRFILSSDFLMVILTFHEMRPSRFLPGTFVNIVSAN
ncbi:hypothetical protein QY702_22055 [Xanthomonas campestris pv. plantaginis]|uniref:hypothetical protein n=1 Tax=Xanthomonas campestris TaxID=339 RepID=UPI002B23A86A|nr:hypothetical protein [Xanthomonas campestris]MEA9609028.1 hypothetical protein [Xanthomonas campestris pv. plantaginis]